MDEPEAVQPPPEPTGRRNGSISLQHFCFFDDAKSGTDWSIDVLKRFTEAGPVFGHANIEKPPQSEPRAAGQTG